MCAALFDLYWFVRSSLPLRFRWIIDKTVQQRPKLIRAFWWNILVGNEYIARVKEAAKITGSGIYC